MHKIDVNDAERDNKAKNDTQTLLLPHYRRNEPSQVAFDKSVMDMIAVDGLPLCFVENIGFINLIRSLDSKLKVKSRFAYKEQIRCTVEKEVEPRLAKLLSEVEDGHCHFSLDIWSSRRREGILGVNTHFLNNNFDLVTRMIAFRQLKDSHTAANIQSSMKEVLRKYGKEYSQVVYSILQRYSVCNFN